MLLEIIASAESHSPWEMADDTNVIELFRDHEWTILIPFFNERLYLPRTLASLAGQTRSARIILIDNGSTDGSAGIAVSECRRHGLPHVLVEESRPGKVAALAAGLAQVRTPFVATCDADTWYPSDYLEQGRRLLETTGSAAAGAYFIDEKASRMQRIGAARRLLLSARLLRGQCHTGGAGQVFRTAALRQAGGFDASRWKYVLEDHEVIHRVLKVGTMEHGAAFWCAPSPRPRDRESTSWTLVERLVYHATAKRAGDWFFYRFLNKRLRARRLMSEQLRERPFQNAEGTLDGAAYPVCG